MHSVICTYIILERSISVHTTSWVIPEETNTLQTSDDLPGFLPKERCLSGGDGGCGVCVAIAREYLITYVIFNKT